MRIELLIKDIRIKKGYTLKQLSRISGVSSTHINDIENNLKKPSFSTILALCKALRVNVNDIYKIK